MNKTSIAVLMALFSVAAAAQQKVVLYGDDDYAPYSFVENGQLKGIYVDLLRMAAKKLVPHYEVTLEPVPWKRGLGALQNGTALALFPPYKIAKRDYIGPYSVPLYHETVVLFCSPGIMAVPRPHFPNDFKHVRIGINLGFALSDRLVEAARTGAVSLEEAKGNQANLRKLVLNRVDCYANDRVSVLYSVKQLQNTPSFLPWRRFKLMEAVELSGQDAYIGYSRAFQAPYKTDFINRMNAALVELNKAGTVERVIADYTRED